MGAAAGRHPGTYAIRLDLSEGQLVFEALAELPFKDVYALIGKLNSRANEIIAEANGGQSQVYMLDSQELKLVVHALGALPFNRVHALLANLNQQARTQVQGRMQDADGTAYGHA